MMNGPAAGALATQGSNGGGQVQRVDMRSLAKDSGTLKGLLESQKDKLASVLPRHLTPDRLMRVVLVAVSKSDLLQKCTVGSILQCVMTSAQLGLDCSGVLGSAYMVPFFNKNVGAYEATLIPGYRGLIDLARRSGEIEDVTAHCVYKDDEFRLELGAEPKLVHRPNLTAERDDRNIVGSYMVAFLKGNTRPHIEFVPLSDIEKVRRSSRAGQKGPWVDWFAEMCRKTAIRRGIKYLPMSVELAEALTLDDQLRIEDETRVVSASTVGRTDSLMKKITSRDVDTGQTFVPDADAIEQAATDNAADQQQDQQQHQEEPDTSGVDAEPFQPAGEALPVVNTWEQTRTALAEAAQDAELPETDLTTRVNLWLIAAGAKGKEDKKTTAKQRLELVTAVREKRLMPDGKIAPAAE